MKKVFGPIVGPLGVSMMLAFGLLHMAAFPAEAAIKCEGQFQVIKGQGKISTPYCQDNYLTKIARTYGWKVSARSVRQNPGLKARICRQIGHDYRLGIICSNHRQENDRNRWSY